MPRKKANIPANETPAQKFDRLATERVNNLLRNYKALGALHGSSYASTADQRKAIEKALRDGVDACMQDLVATGPVQEFKL